MLLSSYPRRNHEIHDITRHTPLSLFLAILAMNQQSHRCTGPRWHHAAIMICRFPGVLPTQIAIYDYLTLPGTASFGKTRVPAKVLPNDANRSTYSLIPTHRLGSLYWPGIHVVRMAPNMLKSALNLLLISPEPLNRF